MFILLIILLITSYICYFFSQKLKEKNIKIKNCSILTQYLFNISFVLSNIILTCIVLLALNVDSFQTSNSNKIIWKFIITLFSIIFYYISPLYILYLTIGISTIKKIQKLVIFYIVYLLITNILYHIYKGIFSYGIFSLFFYVNNIQILEFLSIVGDIFYAVNGSYNAVKTIIDSVVYPLISKYRLKGVEKEILVTKLDSIKDGIIKKQNELNQLNHDNKTNNDKNENKSKEFNNISTIYKEKNDVNFNDNNSTKNTSNENISSIYNSNKFNMQYIIKLHQLNSDLEYLNKEKETLENQIKIKSNQEKDMDIMQLFKIIISTIMVIQKSFFIFGGFKRVLFTNYKLYNEPINVNEDSIISTINKMIYLNLADNIVNILEKIISLSLVILLFITNVPVAQDRIIDNANFIFSPLQNFRNWSEIEIIIVSWVISSYYLVCSLIVVNQMVHNETKDKLHKIFFHGYDYAKLNIYYDVPYVMNCLFLTFFNFIKFGLFRKS